MYDIRIINRDLNFKEAVVMKKISLCLAAVMIITFMLGVGAYAAPYALSGNEVSTSDSLLYIKKPASHSAVTSERSYTVSAVGVPGVDVTVFRKSSLDGRFYRVFQRGYALSGKVGASGVYVVSIELLEGGNKMIVYAENSVERQVIKIDITRLSAMQLERIRSLSIGDIFNY